MTLKAARENIIGHLQKTERPEIATAKRMEKGILQLI